MGIARDGLHVATAAAVALLLVACGSVSPTADESPPTDGPAATAVGDGSPGASAPATPHPLAHEVRDWIAYQTNRSGAEGIWLIHFDGTEDHEVAVDVPGEHHHPDWFPDGTQLLLTSRTETDTLYVLDLETNEARPLWLCSAPCVGDDEAAWSPDGSQIVFVRAMGRGPMDRVQHVPAARLPVLRGVEPVPHPARRQRPRVAHPLRDR